MRIKALSVFERIVYHSWCEDPSNPSRPVLEVEAVLRDGDADDGPLLLPYADFTLMAGPDVARELFADFKAAGRIADHLGVPHLTFPMWQAGDIILR